jgi:hypothetical protein
MSTDLPQRNAMYPPKAEGGPDFQSWKPETLAEFAKDAYAKMQEQADQIMQLQQDLKTAMEAYRSLLRQK